MKELSPREQYSKAMFGAKDALDVFGVIIGFSVEPPQSFTVYGVHQEFFDQSAIDENAIRRNIAKLEALEEIERVPSESQAFHYQRRESPFWELIKSMVSEAIDRELQA